MVTNNIPQPPSCIEPTTVDGRIALALWRAVAFAPGLFALTEQHRRNLAAWCASALSGEEHACAACRVYARVVVAWEDALVLLRCAPGELPPQYVPHDTAELRAALAERHTTVLLVEADELDDDYVSVWRARASAGPRLHVTSQSLAALCVLDQQGGAVVRGWVL